MADIMYDIYKLMECEEFDPNVVRQNLSAQQAYFLKLTEFVEGSSHYLGSYNPTVVIYADDVRNEFLSELSTVKDKLTELGIKLSATDIATLEDAVSNMREKELSDGLLKFAAKMGIIVNQIKTAQISGGAVDDVRPLIMAVDDSPLILNILKEMLEEEFRVIALSSGEEAILAAERHVPDLFLFDIEMPNMNGHELVMKIKEVERYRSIPILFLTSSSTRKNVFAARDLGVNDYILKPVDKNVLLRKIKMNIKTFYNGIH